MSQVFDRYPAGGGEMLLALALADHADDDGTRVYPSVARLAKKTRQSERTVQYQLRKMQKDGWLVLVADENGGRGKAREYRINSDWLKGANIAPFIVEQDAKSERVQNQKGCNLAHKRVQSDAQKGATAIAPEPSLTISNPYTDTDVSVVGNRKTVSDCPHQQIIDLYKKSFPEAVKPQHWTGERASALKARWREEPDRQCLDWWGRFFGYIKESDFLMGRVQALNRDPFKLRLDWIVKKENFYKIIEGFYENG